MNKKTLNEQEIRSKFILPAMSLCDALEAQLARTREKSAHLVASVLHHLGTA